MLKGTDALKTLEADVGIAEASRSDYWDHAMTTFTATVDGMVGGTSVLGTISSDTGFFRTVVHWLLQWPFRYMGREFSPYRECERLGRLIARRAGRQFTLEMMRQILSLALIRHHLRFDNPAACTLVIGDGFGVMSSLLLLAFPARKTITVNLTKSLLLDLAYCRQYAPDATFALVTDRVGLDQAFADPSICLIAVQADNSDILAGSPIDLAINIVSMQEMMEPVVAAYFDIIRSSSVAEVAFYCCNKLIKMPGDGKETRFMDYPWREDDDILVDGLCPWNQWYYSKRPPFWHYRHGTHRQIWHRLARLAGDGGKPSD